MKKLFAALSTLLLATSVSFAQDDVTESATEQNAANEESVNEDSVPQYSTVEEQPTATEETAAPTAPAEEAKAPQAEPEPQYNSDPEIPPEEPAPAPKKKESRLGAGIKFAFGYASIYGFEEEDDDVNENPSGKTYEAGVMLRLNVADNLAFAPEVNVSHAKTSHSYINTKRSYARTDLEIPLLLRGTFIDRIYVTFGPQLNISLSTETKLEGSKFGFVEDIDQSTFDFGVAAGLGARIVGQLYFDFRIYAGLKELFPDVVYLFDEDAVIDPEKDRNWSLIDMTGAKLMKVKFGLSYWFI